MIAQIERCRPWLEPALVDGDTWAEVVDDLLNDRAMLWPGERSAMVTQIVFDPDKTIHVWLGGGDLRELMDLRHGAEAVGRLMGCREASIKGRKGWGKALKSSGWARVGGELRKIL